MSEMDRQSFEETIMAMSGEEKKMALKYFDTDMLWDELRSRETSNRNKIQHMKELVG